MVPTARIVFRLPGVRRGCRYVGGELVFWMDPSTDRGPVRVGPNVGARPRDFD